jgi:hypothetical protein
VLLEDSVTDLFYETTIFLVPGKVYSFIVRARNEVGLSLDSDVLPILAARIPDRPTDLQNNAAVTTAYQSGLVWTPGSFNGGSPVLDYKVSYKLEPDGDYLEFTDYTIVDDYVTVTGLLAGETYTFYV